MTEPTPPTTPVEVPWRIDGGFIKTELGDVICLWSLPGRDEQQWHLLCATTIVEDHNRTIRATTRAPHPALAPWRLEGSEIVAADGSIVAIWDPPGRDQQPHHRADAEFIVAARNMATQLDRRLTKDTTRDAYLLERTTDEDLPAVIGERATQWAGAARAVLEYGERALDDGVVLEQAIAVLLLTREVRRLRAERSDHAGEWTFAPGMEPGEGLGAVLDSVPPTREQVEETANDAFGSWAGQHDDAEQATRPEEEMGENIRTDLGDRYRDHDHEVEAAVDHALEEPTPEHKHLAQLAVSLLQRRYDHVLRRLDGDAEPPDYPSHPHNAAEEPQVCADAALHELAGAVLSDRAETLAHGLEAVHSLARQVDEARKLGTVLYEHLTSEERAAFGEVSEWPWLHGGRSE